MRRTQKLALGSLCAGAVCAVGAGLALPFLPIWLLIFIAFGLGGTVYQGLLKQLAGEAIIDRGPWPQAPPPRKDAAPPAGP